MEPAALWLPIEVHREVAVYRREARTLCELFDVACFEECESAVLDTRVDRKKKLDFSAMSDNSAGSTGQRNMII